MLLTLKFKVAINEIVGTRKITEEKDYSLTDNFESSASIEEIISSATKAIEAKVKNMDASNIEVSCVYIIPETTMDTPANIEEPAHIDESADAFDGVMNPPVGNVVEEIPEGFKESEEIEESPFTNTYFDNDNSDKSEQPEQSKETSSYNYDEMFEKFLKLNFLTRQNLLIKEFNLLPEEHRGDRHKVAFPIAVEVAKKNNTLDKFYEAINAKSAS